MTSEVAAALPADRLGALLWAAQRASAAVLAICVVVHLVTMVVAVQGGLSAAEILGRTRGNVAWFAFYVAFAAAVSVHAPIGLRAIAMEWTRWRGRTLDVATLVVGLALFAWALRAMWGLFR